MGILITFYVLIFAPVSGFSINPARTTGSDVFAHVWKAAWVYFSAPVAGMLFSSECYLRGAGGKEQPSGRVDETAKHYFTHRHLTSHPHPRT
jgi:aquaporin Z